MTTDQADFYVSLTFQLEMRAELTSRERAHDFAATTLDASFEALSSEVRSGADEFELDEISDSSAQRAMAKTASRSIPPSCAASNITPAPVYEVELLLETKDEKGRPVRFGSVGGGGRYDGLVSRFRGEPVPATGFSIGVSRLQAALTMLGKLDSGKEFGPVVVTVFGGDIADYQKMVASLRNAGHPRRTLSRQSQALARPADEICRPPQLALRDRAGLGREGAGARCRSRI